MYTLRDRAHQLINQMLPSPQSALLTGILLGNDNDIPPEINDAFNQTGTITYDAMQDLSCIDAAAPRFQYDRQ